jgi:hypothetical protein
VRKKTRVSGTASAQLAGVEFTSASTSSEAGTGVLGETFVNFSALSLATPTEIGTTGVYINYTASTSNAGDRSLSGGPENIAPFQNGLIGYNGGVSLSFTLSGLTAGDQYNVVGYSGETGDATNLTFVNSGNTGTDLNATKDPTTFIAAGTAGANYFESVETANSSGDILLNVESTASATDHMGHYSEISGIGISAGAIPEPPILMLLGFGSLAVVFLRLRRSAQV